MAKMGVNWLNDKEFAYLGIKKWHEAGYRGQGIKIASHEKIIEGVFDDVFCLNYGSADNKYTKHGTLVMDYIRQVAPDAIKLSIESDDEIINNELKSEAIDYLLKYTPDLLGTANHSGFIDRKEAKPYYEEIYNKGCFLCCSAGNEQEKINKLALGDLWKAIGACRYNNGKPKVEHSYVDGEEMDFVSFHNLKSTYNNKKNKGSSFSYPVFIGMLALVQCYFLKNIGRKLNHEELINFVKENCIDLEETGHDIKTGYGLFVLPDPYKIDLSKYKGDNGEIVLTIESNIAYVDGKEILLDTPPVINNNRTLVPIRFVAENLGYKVEWNEEKRQVIIKK